MRSYIIMVAGAALLSAFSDMISPQSWRKYTKIVTGLIVLAVLLTPILKIKDADLFEGFSFDEQAVQSDRNIKAVAEELKHKVEEDAMARIKMEYNTETDITAEIKTDDDGKIICIEKMYVHADKNESKIRKRLAEVYGVEETEVVVGL